jgi:ferredoxin
MRGAGFQASGLGLRVLGSIGPGRHMPKLTFVRHAKTFEVESGTRFVEFCEDHPGLHEFGCQVGSCGTCVSTIESGASNLNPPSRDELDTIEMCTDVPSARLGCQLTILGDVAIKQIVH